MTFEHFSKASAVGGDISEPEPAGMWWSAFYADCFHEIDELTQGSRVALVYNLTGKPKGKYPTAAGHVHKPLKMDPVSILTAPPQPSDETVVAQIAAALNMWAKETDDAYPDYKVENRNNAGYRWGGDHEHSKPIKLVAVLSHSYTPQDMKTGMGCLKGRDRIVAKLLLEASTCTLDPSQPLSLVDSALKSLITNDPANYQAADATSAELATVQDALADQAVSSTRIQPPEFDAYLALCVVWDSGECTPENSFFTTGPLVALTPDTPHWPSNTACNPPQWSKQMFHGETDELDGESMMEEFAEEHCTGSLAHAERTTARLPCCIAHLLPRFEESLRSIAQSTADDPTSELGYEEQAEAFFESKMVSEPRITNYDLEIDDEELLLTDPALKQVLFQGDSIREEAPGSIEFLGNGCPYPGQWYSRAAIVFWPKSERDKISGQIAARLQKKARRGY